jgi:hypothetical protein
MASQTNSRRARIDREQAKAPIEAIRLTEVISPGVHDSVRLTTFRVLKLAEGARSAAFVPYVTADGGDGETMRDSRRNNADALGEGSPIMADELQGIRAFGLETEMKTLMSEVARRQQLIKNDMELTKDENKEIPFGKILHR